MKDKKPLVVNLFGVPGSGKSTCASLVFTKLKMQRMNVELVTEFAKERTWEENKYAFENQAYLFGNQSYRLSLLKNKVDVIITDSPLPLSILHNKDKVLGEKFYDIVMDVFNSYNNINFLILRDKSSPYDTVGRHETEEESDDLQKPLENLLKKRTIDYEAVLGTESGYLWIAESIIGKLKGE